MKSVDGMRLYQRDNGIWYVELQHNIVRSLKTKDEREAKFRFSALQREKTMSKFVELDKVKSMSLQSLITAYLEWCGINRAPNTCNRTERALQKLSEVVGKNKDVYILKKKDLDVYVSYCKSINNNNVTINIG